MTAKIYKKMVYSYLQPMWHALQEPSLVPSGAVQVLDERFDGGVSIELAPLEYVLPDGTKVPYEGMYGILRSPMAGETEWFPLGTCTERFHPLQPRAIAERFDQVLNVPVETMAFLGDGEDMFISWELPSIDVAGYDRVNMYGILRIGFDGKHGGRLFVAAVRPICWNTICAAQGWADKHSGGNKLVGNQWRGKNVSKDLLEVMGYWMEHVQTNAQNEASKLKNFFEALTRVPVTDIREVDAILEKAFPHNVFDPERTPHQLHEKTQKAVNEYNESQDEIRAGIRYLFGDNGTAITPDLWGVLNATTEYVCHYMPSKKPVANSVMFGDRSSITGRVMSVLQSLL